MKVNFSLSTQALAKWDPAIKAATGLNIFGVIGDEVRISHVMQALEEADGADITVNVNSPGGSVFEGLAIYNALQDYSGQVHIKVLGLAASAASVIALAGDQISIAKSAFFMIHNAWTIAVGNRHDMAKVAQQLEPFDNTLAQIYADKTGIKVEEISKLMDNETWISGEDAVKYGYANSILSEEPEKDDAEGDKKAVAEMDYALAKAGLSRSERRRLMHEFKSLGDKGGVKPGADTTDMSGAVNEIRELANSLNLILKST